MRIARDAMPGIALDARTADEPWSRERILGSEWRYIGSRGESGQTFAYRRQRKIHVDAPGWPPTGEEKLPIGVIRSTDLAVTLVPADGSLVELRAPDNFVKETDPAAAKRQFGGDDIFAMRLIGLEDNARRRTVRLEVANGIARSSIYDALESMTAWGIIRLLFGGLPAIAVGYLLTRWLKRRFPDPARTS